VPPGFRLMKFSSGHGSSGGGFVDANAVSRGRPQRMNPDHSPSARLEHFRNYRGANYKHQTRGAGCHPAADCQSASPVRSTIQEADSQSAADCQSAPHLSLYRVCENALICSKWFIQWNERGSRLTAPALLEPRRSQSPASTRCEILSVDYIRVVMREHHLIAGIADGVVPGSNCRSELILMAI